MSTILASGVITIPPGDLPGEAVVSCDVITGSSLVFITPQSTDIYYSQIASITAGVGFAVAYYGAAGQGIAWQIIQPT